MLQRVSHGTRHLVRRQGKKVQRAVLKHRKTVSTFSSHHILPENLGLYFVCTVRGTCVETLPDEFSKAPKSTAAERIHASANPSVRAFCSLSLSESVIITGNIKQI